MLNDKKGISPLIATVLIIGFTIVVAVLVITWINSLVGDQTDDQACKANALEQCTDANRFLSYTVETVDSASSCVTTVKASNSGPITPDVNVIALDDSGANLGSAVLNPAEYGSDEDNTTFVAYTMAGSCCDVDTTCSETDDTQDIAEFRFVTEVAGEYGDVSCTETCGDGEVVEA